MPAVVLRYDSLEHPWARYVVADLTEWKIHQYNSNKRFTVYSRHARLDEATSACTKKNEEEKEIDDA